jgi:hypothetical protein
MQMGRHLMGMSLWSGVATQSRELCLLSSAEMQVTPRVLWGKQQAVPKGKSHQEWNNKTQELIPVFTQG